MGWYDRKVRRVRDLSCGDTRIFLDLEVRRIACRDCGKVKREQLDFLADSPLYTKRFADFVGRRCRQSSILDVAKELTLDGHIVKALVTLDGKRALKTLLAANKRLNTAYMLKESFGELRSYERGAWARRFFENWRASLKWQRLKPLRKFAAMIERHGDGIAAYRQPENKVSLGFVEGINNKIRVIQRRAHGLRNEEYFRLKVLTACCPNYNARTRIGPPTHSIMSSSSQPSRMLRAAKVVARRCAILYRCCARRHVAPAGRDGRMVPIEQKDKDGASKIRRKSPTLLHEEALN